MHGDLVLNQNSKKAKGTQQAASYVGKRYLLDDLVRTKLLKSKKLPIRKPSNGLTKVGPGQASNQTRGLGKPILNRGLGLPRGHFPSKRGRSMVDHFYQKPGRRVSRTTSFPSGRVTVDYDQLVPALTDWLSNVQTAHGNFKAPTPQRFTHRVKRVWNGIGIAEIRNNGVPQSTTIVEGVSPKGSQTDYLFPSFPDTTTYNKGLSKLYDKLRGDIDISIDLAESHKTHGMMRDTFRSMISLATTFRKMKRSNPRDWGNLWLEYTYGWKPLATSIYGTAKKLMLPDPQGPQKFNVSVSAAEETLRGTKEVADVNWLVPEKWIAYCRSRVRFVVQYVVSPSALIKLAGFTSLNPVSIAYELTPYSFVVDWFVNIGGYLRDFESALLYGTSFSGGYVTETCLGEAFVEQVGTAKGPISFGQQTTFTTAWRGSERYTEKRRTVLTATPYPRPPKFDPHLGASRLISGAALLGQMLTSLEHSKGYGSPSTGAPSLADKARRRAGSRAFETASKNFSDWERELRRANPKKIFAPFDKGSFIP